MHQRLSHSLQPIRPLSALVLCVFASRVLDDDFHHALEDCCTCSKDEHNAALTHKICTLCFDPRKCLDTLTRAFLLLFLSEVPNAYIFRTSSVLFSSSQPTYSLAPKQSPPLSESTDRFDSS